MYLHDCIYSESLSYIKRNVGLAYNGYSVSQFTMLHKTVPEKIAK